ncbi:MAG TPA: RNA 2',3'-cyclic phosphodiesterase [Candidatus Omnitrophota bacterium]|nr:RNA 2',3'-cyclic phosphodiesterase [Candidatus Omnitrophota bacterium]HQL41434.1 RNA 2',3'-cyclic phosphodiesterase [Candidatus Omnitrophota bacterium]
MRVFVGIDLDKNIKDAINELRQDLRSCNEDVRWVEPQNAHLTLKFIGDVKSDKIDDLSRTLVDTLKDVKAFTIKIDHFGCFPNEKRAQILWLGVSTGAKKAGHIAEMLEQRLEPFCSDKNKKVFLPHITIAKARNVKDLNRVIALIKERKHILSFQQNVSSIILFKSVISPSGAIYKKMINVYIS